MPLSSHHTPSIRSVSSVSSSSSSSIYSAHNLDHAFPAFIAHKKNVYELAGFDVNHGPRHRPSNSLHPNSLHPNSPLPQSRSDPSIPSMDHIATHYTGAHPPPPHLTLSLPARNSARTLLAPPYTYTSQIPHLSVSPATCPLNPLPRPLSDASSVYSVFSDRPHSLNDSIASPNNTTVSIHDPTTDTSTRNSLNQLALPHHHPSRGRSVLSATNQPQLKDMQHPSLVTNLSQPLQRSVTPLAAPEPSKIAPTVPPAPPAPPSSSSRVCRACHNPISGKSVSARPALSGRFHPTCFKCRYCHLSFRGVGTEIYVFDDTAYCRECYHIVNHSRCAGCTTGIEGPCLETTTDASNPPNSASAPALRYHPNCLQCGTCHNSITDMEYYVLDGKTYCDAHGPEMLAALKALENMAIHDKKATNKRLTVVEKRKTKLLYM